MSMLACFTSLSNLITVAPSELQAQYYAAVESCEVAEQAEAAAKKEWHEKSALLLKAEVNTKKRYLGHAECWKAQVALLEKIEQRYAAEYEGCLCYRDCMKHKHGADSKKAQIAQHRAELARTMEFVCTEGSPYWTKWNKLSTKASWVLDQLKAEGYDNIADELFRTKKAFCDRIEKESNSEAFRNARNAAGEALDKWEQENDRAAWNKAKRTYDAELAKWNEFIPKGEQYAKELEETINSCIKSFAPISELLSHHIGKSVVELQEEAKQDPHAAKDLELLKKYDAAAKIYQVTNKAEAAAKKERDEKRTLAEGTQKGTKEDYLAWAEKQKAEITFLEKKEQRCGAEYAVYGRYADFMKHEHGAASKKAQKAQYRAELSRTREFVCTESSPYWIKWYKLSTKASWVYHQLKAEGSDNCADELKRHVEAFWNRIKEFNGEAFCTARNLAVEALNKWEQENDYTGWNEAKRTYDAALAKWNNFKPKGELYAKELEEQICKCVQNYSTVHAIVHDYEISALKDELEQKDQQIGALMDQLGWKGQKIDDLEDKLGQRDHEIALLKDELGRNSHQTDGLENELGRKGQEIAALSDELDQQSRENDILYGRIGELERTVGEMRTWIQSLIHMNQSSISWQYKQLEELEALARTTLEQEWQHWSEKTMYSHAHLVNWIQERIAEMTALEEEEATTRNKYKHEFYDSIKEIERVRFALGVVLSGWILE
ncbi:uncharacterized protein TM35_000084470 [Trypanosoma theileri]|uniref:Uncharacterized protein n=1 Tax=Trypanosoma theileri TaxID=67003 RepID=A0A1X0P293_9TRYP|nr:uncharacterized protein TM35_000084470 [Trypanosoma theileri]ORC90649.1 hypothetical protein TM35_000084470 [Trypanosoma theileri]